MCRSLGTREPEVPRLMAVEHGEDRKPGATATEALATALHQRKLG